MAITLALMHATIQMLKENNLVRVVASCETMGQATSIFLFFFPFFYFFLC